MGWRPWPAFSQSLSHPQNPKGGKIWGCIDHNLLCRRGQCREGGGKVFFLSLPPLWAKSCPQDSHCFRLHAMTSKCPPKLGPGSPSIPSAQALVHQAVLRALHRHPAPPILGPPGPPGPAHVPAAVLAGAPTPTEWSPSPAAATLTRPGRPGGVGRACRRIDPAPRRPRPPTTRNQSGLTPTGSAPPPDGPRPLPSRTRFLARLGTVPVPSRPRPIFKEALRGLQSGFSSLPISPPPPLPSHAPL